MSEKWITAMVTVAIAIIGVAVIAVLVSDRAQTAGVLGATATGLKNALCVALSPIGVKCESATSTITYPGLNTDCNGKLSFLKKGC